MSRIILYFHLISLLDEAKKGSSIISISLEITQSIRQNIKRKLFSPLFFFCLSTKNIISRIEGEGGDQELGIFINNGVTLHQMLYNLISCSLSFIPYME